VDVATLLGRLASAGWTESAPPTVYLVTESSDEGAPIRELTSDLGFARIIETPSENQDLAVPYVAFRVSWGCAPQAVRAMFEPLVAVATNLDLVLIVGEAPVTADNLDSFVASFNRAADDVRRFGAATADPEYLSKREAARQAARAARHGRINSNIFRRLDEFPLSVRAANVLAHAHIVLVGELVQMAPDEVVRVKNLGRKALRELEELLRSLNLELDTPIPRWPRLLARWQRRHPRG